MIDSLILFARKLLVKLVAVFAAFIPGIAFAIQPYNLPVGVTETSKEIFDLHMFGFWISFAIGVFVFAIMLWSIIFHRKSVRPTPAKFSHSLKLEILWTVVPIIILVALMIPATQVLTRTHDSSNAEIDIKITGYQWRWHYEYLDERVKFFSNINTPEEQISNQEEKTAEYLLEVDKEIVIPVNTKVRFLLTSADVLHAWWVPDLGVKKDAIPGFINEMWTIVDEEGVYRGQCAELCGTRHAFMPIVVRAVSRPEYDDWLAERQQGAEEEAALAQKADWTPEELLERGKQVYSINCIACHQTSGKGLPPAFPALIGSSVVLGPKAAQIDILLNGRSGTTMQAFGALLSDSDIAAVITHTRNSWGNSGQDQTVFPQDVAAQRSK
ncbi:MAG: cytochrome c oxidase subunit II [Candidatus Portiera sp.]|nr:cytochrome c oxidase subunit II [Portiera sp.]